REPARNAHTKTGIDVLAEEDFAPLRGKRVALITNQTGLDRDGRGTIQLLAHADGVKLVALFSPEHGIAGRAEDKVSSSTDPATGLPIYSLYGDTRRPADEMLRGIDALVFDIPACASIPISPRWAMQWRNPRSTRSPSMCSTGRTHWAARPSKARCSTATG
ncbi:MAG: hypothetical protein DMG29_20060, partial [Acidobacteria bacterium]